MRFRFVDVVLRGWWSQPSQNHQVGNSVQSTDTKEILDECRETNSEHRFKKTTEKNTCKYRKSELLQASPTVSKGHWYVTNTKQTPITSVSHHFVSLFVRAALQVCAWMWMTLCDDLCATSYSLTCLWPDKPQHVWHDQTLAVYRRCFCFPLCGDTLFLLPNFPFLYFICLTFFFYSCHSADMYDVMHLQCQCWIKKRLFVCVKGMFGSHTKPSKNSLWRTDSIPAAGTNSSQRDTRGTHILTISHYKCI